jgi:hypothetical protein
MYAFIATEFAPHSAMHATSSIMANGGTPTSFYSNIDASSVPNIPFQTCQQIQCIPEGRKPLLVEQFCQLAFFLFFPKGVFTATSFLLLAS